MMKKLCLSGEFTDEAPCCRQASACQGGATKAVSLSVSPFERGLSGTSITNQRFLKE